MIRAISQAQIVMHGGPVLILRDAGYYLVWSIQRGAFRGVLSRHDTAEDALDFAARDAIQGRSIADRSRDREVIRQYKATKCIK